MEQHMKVSDMPAFCSEINGWLSGRYGTEQGGQIWEATCRQYEEYLKELTGLWRKEERACTGSLRRAAYLFPVPTAPGSAADGRTPGFCKPYVYGSF